MSKYFINENYIAKNNQQVFYTNKPFVDGTISVFLNGALQALGEDKDYIALSETGQVIFNLPLKNGDKVSIISNIASNNIRLEVISNGRVDKKNTLYKKYGTVQRLKYNNKYEVCICIDNDNIKYSFISQLNPLFCSSKRIYEDIGEFIEGFTDEYINSLLYHNSVEVIELIDDLKEEDIENVHYDKDNKDKYTTKDRAIINWVRYKTDIDLIMARYYGISLRYGSIKKTVGDINIERDTKLPYLDDLLDRLKKQYDEADKVIRGFNVVASAVKGIINYKYDDWARETKF